MRRKTQQQTNRWQAAHPWFSSIDRIGWPSSSPGSPREACRSLLVETLEARRLLAGDIVISEFVASNESTLRDQDGDSSDWLELFNVSPQPIDLAGWHLTDNPEVLDKWTFPSQTIDPGQYLVVFASEKDRVDPAEELHTNFRLSAGGEYLALVEPDSQTIVHAYAPFPPQQTDVAYGVSSQSLTSDLIGPDSVSRVFIPTATTDIPTETWTATSFDDGAWSAASAAVGFSTGRFDELIHSDDGNLPAAARSSASTYVRIPFDLDDSIGTYDQLDLSMQYDDGFAAYLNGTLVATRNAPDELDGQSTATEEHGGTIIDFDYPILRDAIGLSQLGSARLESDNVRLTDAAPSQSGAAWSNIPLPFGPRFSFSAFMTIDVTQPGGEADDDGPGGHGMAFVLQSGGQFRLGDQGGALGLEGSGMPFVAVEFDSRADGAFDTASSSPSHLGINSSVAGSVAQVAVSRFNGSTQSDPRHVWIDYDGVTQVMDVYLSTTPNRPPTPTLSAEINLASIFEGVSSLWTGWTAANGSDAWNQHEVLDFRMTTTSEPAFDAESFDLSAHTDVLRPGQNVLAIHGLNRTADDDDFLIKPILTATRTHHVDLATPGYFQTATPGGENSLRAEAPSSSVAFSVTGRTFVDPFTLTITAESDAAEIRYTTDGRIPDANSTLYRGPLSIDASTRIRARAFEPGKSGGPVTSHGYIQLGTELTNFEGGVFDSNLPLMVFHSFGGDVHTNASSLVPVSSVFFDNASGSASLADEPTFAGRAGLRIRGQSSQGWPKKQYALEIWDEGNSDNRPISAGRAADRAISIFGLPQESDWVLNGPYSDKTQLNNFLTFQWSRAMGLYAPRARLVEVFVKTRSGALNYRTDYRGTYVLLEKIKIDPNRVNIQELSPDVTEEPDISGGYIWKYDKDGVGDVNFTTTFQSRTGSTRPWKFVEPQRPPISQRNWLRNHLREFESVLYGANFADPANGYAKYIDVDSWVDTWLLVEFTKNIDGFRLSTYYHKDRGGKIHQGPAWDYNLSLANSNYLNGAYPSGWYHNSLSSQDYPYWDRLFEDPNFELRVRDRWFELRKTIFSTDNLLRDVDNAVQQLTNDNPTLGQVAAGEASNPISRNFDRWRTLTTYLWPNCFFGTGVCPTSPLPNRAAPSTYGDYIFILRDFIHGRSAWIDRQFRTPPTIHSSTIDEVNSIEITLERNTSGSVYYTLNGTDPRDPETGELSADAIRYETPFVIEASAQVQARTWSSSRWSAKASENFIVKIPSLTISELNYNPADPSSAEVAAGYTDNDDFEYLELTNWGDESIDLGGMQIQGGIEVTFASATVDPGVRVVVVRNAAAFRTRYGSDAQIVGQYGVPLQAALDYKLQNSGELLRLVGRFGEVIEEFTYDDSWYPLTDGDGYSLVRRQPITGPSLSEHGDWRPSEFQLGSPGFPESGVVPAPNHLRIHEIYAAESGVPGDTLELWNSTDQPIAIGGYRLTQADSNREQQFVLPEDTVVPPQGYLQLTTAPWEPNFQLIPFGGTVTLRGALPDGTLTGYQDVAVCDTTIGTKSCGLTAISTGFDFALLTAATPGGPNADPVTSTIVISEIQYHPSNDGPEFIELHNASDKAAQLTNWEFTQGIRYRFPEASIAAGGYLVLLQVDESSADEMVEAFRQTHDVPREVPILTYTQETHGSLDNAGETLTLQRPTPGLGRLTEPDRIAYSDAYPWPTRADGAGPSLSRLDVDSYGNDPANWATSTQTGTPGRRNQFEDTSPPTAPQSLAASVLPDSRVGLGWQVSTDPESQVAEYTVYRNGRLLGTTRIPFFADAAPWTTGQQVTYTVTAQNPDGFESAHSNAIEVDIEASHFQRGTNGYAGAADSQIREQFPDENYGDVRRLGLDGNEAGSTGSAMTTLIRWSNLEIPTSHQLVGAQITVNVGSPGDNYGIRPLHIAWNEAEVTWNQAATGQAWQLAGAQGAEDVGDTIGELAFPRRGATTARLNQLGLRTVQSWLEDPATNFGIAIGDDRNATDGASIESAESTSAERRPLLTLYHTSLPDYRAGDMNFDGRVDAQDLDAMHAALREASQEVLFDLDQNGALNSDDVDFLLANMLGTTRGDANLDGQVNFADFVILSASFGQATSQSWSEGDFDGDGSSGFADFLLLSSNFGRTADGRRLR